LPLETATFIPDLTTSNPAHTDGLSQADSHMRLIKATVKNTFPNFTSAALQSTQAQLDAAATAIAGTAYYRFLMGTAALPAITPVGNPNTGLWSPAANQLAVSLGGVNAATWAGGVFNSVLPFGAPAVVSTGAYSGGTGQLVPIGHTGIWWDDVLPTEGGYAWANGQIIASANTVCPVLLARWGSRFGGNGVTTMGVPDLRDTVPVGKSTMGGAASRALQTLTNTVLGTLIGLANNVLVLANLPPITSTNPTQAITVATGNAGGTGNVSIGGVINSDDGVGGGFTHISGAVVGSATSTGNNAISVTSTGTTSTAVNNVQPSTTCNYIIRIG
jgi:microcystin-dependent protein